MNSKLLRSAGLAAALLLPLGAPGRVSAALITGSASPAAVIPDNDLDGLASTITLTANPGEVVTQVQLTLNITSGFNGDYYAYLQHGSALVVLLNNLSGSPGNPYGSPGAGFNVTFSDAAANISTAPVVTGAPLSGTWAPQAGSLSAFNSLDPNGDWTLLIADESPGGVGTLQNWSLSVTASPTPVPEAPPALTGLLALGLALAFTRLGRSRRKRNRLP